MACNEEGLPTCVRSVEFPAEDEGEEREAADEGEGEGDTGREGGAPPGPYLSLEDTPTAQTPIC